MKRIRFGLVAAVLAFAPTFGTAVTARAATPPAGLISSNLEFLANATLPGGVQIPGGAYSLAFIGKNVFASSVTGIYSFDVSDPANPKFLGVLPMYIYENEHMTSDPKRNLIFISRDPRGFTGPVSTTSPVNTYFPYGAIQVIDVSNPMLMTQVSMKATPAGHTATCINDCHYLWIGGPRVPAIQTPGVGGTIPPGADPTWAGRPIWAVDVTDPANLVDCPHWIDTANNDGVTDYSHSVDVDANGVAWVSGSGHLRGFWTSGQHYNPVSGHTETATGCDPIPYAGGGTNEGQIVIGAVIHNSGHPLDVAVDGRAGDVVDATEENVVSDCKTSGRFLTYDIGSSYQGQGFINTANTHFRLRKLDAWWPENKPGSTGCASAHWFTERDPDHLVAIAFYDQGTRILDASDPFHIKQLAWFHPIGASVVGGTWAAYWQPGNLVYTADADRGIDVLRYTDGVTNPREVGHLASSGSGGTPGTSTGMPASQLAVGFLLAAALVAAAAAVRRWPGGLSRG